MFPTSQFVALPNGKWYISLANHGGRTSMSAHVADGSRWDFRETRRVRKAPNVRKVPGFSQFLEKSLWRHWRFLERFNYPIRKENIPNKPFWCVIECVWYIFMANPGGRTSMSAHVVAGARGDFRNARKARKVPGFRNFRIYH